MEGIRSLLSWQLIAAGLGLYTIGVAVYRLTFHPLARFPGPKIAAVTRYYEAYYDVVQNAQYTFQIEKMHKKYGPIVRISPEELHIDDPAFVDKLYRHDGRWDKYAWSVDSFGLKGATIFTPEHYLHKARRQPVNAFFSKAKVASRQGLIKEHVEKFCDRINEFAEAQKPVNLGSASTAIARDIANDYISGRTYSSLDQEDFDVGMINAGQASKFASRLAKHAPWVSYLGLIFKLIPTQWLADAGDEDMKRFIGYVHNRIKVASDLIAKASSPDPDPETPRTVVHEIVQSKLPDYEKTFSRVMEDLSTMAAAGFETTATVLRLVFLNIYSKPEILQRVRAELASAAADAPDGLDLKTLEKLPYLTAVISEGLRMNPAIGSRSARIAPDRDVFYEDWRIPAGTPVGMTLVLMHTDGRFHENPRRFEPERWINPDLRKSSEKAFAPFSKGSRNCIGMYLAWADLYLITAAVVQRFNFEFEEQSSEDFEYESGDLASGTTGKGLLRANVTLNEKS